MKDEEKVSIYNKGVKEGQKHAVSSPETQRFMEYIKDKLNANCKNIDKLMNDSNHLEIKYEVMCKDVADIKEDIGELKKTLNDFISSADSRFASKRVENVLWAAGGIIGTAIVLALLRLIFKIEV
jgi:hypothetical protein